MQAQKQMYTSHLLKNGNKKLALLIKIKLDNIRLNCHKITINEKEAPTIKAVDRPDQWTTIATSSRHRQSNSIVKRNVKLWSPKCQLNFITSTKILANQTQIQTKTQPETISHPKHIVQTRDNDNISKSIKRKKTQSKKNFIKPQLQIHRKRNSKLNAPLQINNKATLCLQLRYIYKQRRYTKMFAINGIRLVSKYHSQSEKGQSHRLIKLQSRLVVYITVTIHHFLMFFYLMLFLNFRLFILFF